jgi:DNA-binding transcriptional ArsR family regulator
MDAVDIFRSLGDPTRLAVFQCIADQELNVSELTSRFDVSQPAISQALSVLYDCELVERRRKGKHVFYRARPEGIRPVMDWLGHYRAFWQAKLPRLESVLKEMKNEG